jgi:hypothetical protein
MSGAIYTSGPLEPGQTTSQNPHFTPVTADQGLDVNEEEYKALKVALGAANQDDAYGQCGQWGIDYSDGKVYIFARFGERWWPGLPCAFLALLGTLIANNGLAYLEFREAFTCDKLRMGSSSGPIFRVRSNGSVWEPNNLVTL